MTEPRIIKKYPNRRLYDTAISKYITLEDVRRLVLEQINFCVRDAKTNDEITRSILLQIIMEQEEDGEPIFSERVLEQIIRTYGDSLQGMMTSYLEKSLSLFTEQQGKWREQVESVISGDPLSAMRDMTEQNLAVWKEMQEGFLRAAMPGTGRDKSEAKKPPEKTTPPGKS